MARWWRSMREGRPDFSLLQDRTGLRGLEAATGRRSRRRPRISSADERAAIPLAYMVFDLLHLDGSSLLDVPLEERKRLLRRVIRPHPMVRYAAHVVGDGEAFVRRRRRARAGGHRRQAAGEPLRARQALARLAEDQAAPRAGAGRRRLAAGQGSHADLGSLIVAVNDDGRLRHAGQVGSGISTAMRRHLLDALEPLRRDDSPLDPVPRLPAAHWVEPRIVIRAEFAEWTSDGLLRQAAFKGIEVEQGAGGRGPRGGDCRRPGSPPALAGGRRHRRPVQLGGTSRSRQPARRGAGRSRRHGARGRLAGRRPRACASRTWTRCSSRPEGEPPGAHQARPDPPLRHASGRSWCRTCAGRGLNLQRFPDGIGKAGFWQKDLPGHAPSWIAPLDLHRQRGRQGLRGGRPRRDARLAGPGGGDRAAPLDLANRRAGSADLSRSSTSTRAPATTFDEVLVLARLFRTALGHLGVIGLPKVTGKRGVQIWVPVEPIYSFEQTRDWVEQLSRAVGQTVPELVSWEWSKRDRRRARASRLHPERHQPDAGGALFGAAARPGRRSRRRSPGRSSTTRRSRSDRWTIDYPAGAAGGGGRPVRARPAARRRSCRRSDRAWKSRGVSAGPGSHRSGAARGDVRTMNANDGS